MPLRSLRRTIHTGWSLFIILFVLWHGMAIAIYAIPSAAEGPITSLLRKSIGPIIRPYILWTSQWQQWNLFAPNPLRRVTHYHLQRFYTHENQWNDVVVFRPGTFLWWKHATRFKILDRIFDLEDRARKIPLQKHFLEKMCDEFKFPRGTLIRILFQYYVIPNTPQLTSFTWWKKWEPSWYPTEGTSIPCP